MRRHVFELWFKEGVKLAVSPYFQFCIVFWPIYFLMKCKGMSDIDLII